MEGNKALFLAWGEQTIGEKLGGVSEKGVEERDATLFIFGDIFGAKGSSSFPVSSMRRIHLRSNMADQHTSDSTGTSSSSQSQSIPSSASMDSAGTAATLPTQDVVDGMSDEEEQKICNWGRLFPLGIGFEKIG